MGENHKFLKGPFLSGRLGFCGFVKVTTEKRGLIFVFLTALISS